MQTEGLCFEPLFIQEGDKHAHIEVRFFKGHTPQGTVQNVSSEKVEVNAGNLKMQWPVVSSTINPAQQQQFSL